jgi:hypothetical protein
MSRPLVDGIDPAPLKKFLVSYEKDEKSGLLRGVDRFGVGRFDVHDAGVTANRKCVAWSVDSTARWISGIAASPKCSNIRVPEPSSTGTR